MNTASDSSICLRLAKSNLWQCHGALNVVSTFTWLAILLLCAVVFLTGRISNIKEAMFILGLATAMLFMLLGHTGELRSLRAVFSNRPYLTLSSAGIDIDGGMFDRWFLSWEEIAVMAPDPQLLRMRLSDDAFCAITFQLSKRSRRRRWFSNIQHLRHPRIFQVCGYFKPLSEAEAERVVAILLSRVKRHEASLLWDGE